MWCICQWWESFRDVLLEMLKMAIIITVCHVNAFTKTATFYVLNWNGKEKQLNFNTTKLLRIPHLRAGFFSLHALRRFTDLLNPDWEVRKQSRIKSECNDKMWKQDIYKTYIKRQICMLSRYEVTCKSKQQSAYWLS